MTKVWVLTLLFFPMVGLANTPAKIIKIYANYGGGFAGLLDDGTITGWGTTGSAEKALEALDGARVTEIISGECAFAALTESGRLVTWGPKKCGGNSSAVANKLFSGVKKVYSSRPSGWGDGFDGSAFAALKEDGSVVTWGTNNRGGDSSGVASSLESGVVKMASISDGFAALKEDGSVVTWWYDSHSNFTIKTRGGERDVSLSLKSGIVDIYSGYGSFVALKGDGRLVGWGGTEGATYSVSHNRQYEDSQIVDIVSTDEAYVALKDDGSLLAWGSHKKGGNISAIANRVASGVVKVFANKDSFAALKDDGTVVTWGGGLYDGDAWEYTRDGWGNPVKGNRVEVNKTGVKVVDIFPGLWGFVALREDGTVAVWGYQASNAAMSAVVGSDRVASVVNSKLAFAAIKENGSVVTWGEAASGGDSSSVSSQLQSNIIQVVGTGESFSALKSDGSTVTW